MIVYTKNRYAGLIQWKWNAWNVHNDDGIHLFHEKWIACKCVQQQWNSIISATNNDRIHSIFVSMKSGVKWVMQHGDGVHLFWWKV